MLTYRTLCSGGELFGCGARAAGWHHADGYEWDRTIATVACANGFDVRCADVCDVRYEMLVPVQHLHASPSCKTASQANTGATETSEDQSVADAIERSAFCALRSDDQLSLFDQSSPDSTPTAPAPAPHRRRGEYMVPLHHKVEYCKSCGREIIWARTPGKKAIPLSLKTVRTAKDGRRWCLSHFVDCEQGKEWSKK